MTPSYRADIDGLRAIAVLAILLFHVGVDGFGGGYVGVDIFFVISGFLITTIIVREIDAGSFSVARFYERRVRRILPALVVLIVATLAAGCLLLAPAQLEELAKSALATSVFASNVFFFTGTGYFDGPSEAKPLLHTWSLAVEEQFYILFPWLLLLIAKRWRLAPPVLGLALLSLVACVVMTRLDASAAFFLFPFRAWELLTGAILALGVLPQLESAGRRNAVAIAGLSLVLASVFVLEPSTPFPGYAALLPTAGTAMVIHAGSGGDSAVARALGVRPLVFVGLVSYSLYLWHWPIVVYAKQYLINEPTDLQAALIVVASLLLATLSWRYVEGPFRDRARFGPRPRLFAGAALVSVLLISAAAALVSSGGLPGRQVDTAFGEVVAADPGWQHWKNCEELGEENERNPELCRIGEGNVAPSFLLWGDSHALALASAVNLSALHTGAAGLMAVRTGCPPLLSVDRPGRESCARFNEAVLSRLEREPDIVTVVLAARWTLAANGDRYGNEAGDAVTLVDLQAPPRSSGGNAAVFRAGVERTVAAIEASGRRVVLVGQVPEIGYDVPASSFAASLRGKDVTAMIAPTVAEFEERSARVDDVLNDIRARHEVTVVEPAERLCRDGLCQVVADGVPLYRDDNHLSLRGCVLVAELFDPLLASAARSQR